MRQGFFRDEDARIVFAEPRRKARLAVDPSSKVPLEQPDVDACEETASVEAAGIRQNQAIDARRQFCGAAHGGRPTDRVAEEDKPGSGSPPTHDGSVATERGAAFTASWGLHAVAIGWPP